MTKVRQDAWSHEDDLLLAETVLRHVREGSTQLDAFEEVGDKLNRTGAACGFRWNAIVRKKYEKAVDLAKKQRKQLKRAQQKRPVRSWQTPYTQETYSPEASTPQPQVMNQSAQGMTLQDVIVYLQNLKTNDHDSERLKVENETLWKKNEELENTINAQQKEIEKLKKKHETIEEDYQSLISIMDRARRMVMLSDEAEAHSPSFKMDKNGNLEKLAK
ncbi:prespore-specific regulator [Pullulanibacillus pueri]|uniref:Transcriptional regulator n=1 Tax=Pullulanibacillus pueri TaxID=1437324 RepID=A0A8J3EMT8_9BACL|nr:RsfA family transcriptional regulator [Pullulanibacillus pueri]MBM7683255.1 prespore-specific regulator [Pullulanibacillus pueri]GGH85744.1 transcriptional regulator [Pullulanibacillus pueri]